MPLLFSKENIDAPLSKRVIAEHNKLINAVQQFSDQNYSEKLFWGPVNKISVADIIATQIGLGNLLIKWYHKGVQRKEVKDNSSRFLLGQHFMAAEGFNGSAFIALTRHHSIEYMYDGALGQHQKFQETVQQIIVIIEHEYTAGNLDSMGVWGWCTLPSSKIQWPLSEWIKINTVHSYKKASSSLNTYLKQKR